VKVALLHLLVPLLLLLLLSEGGGASKTHTHLRGEKRYNNKIFINS